MEVDADAALDGFLSQQASVRKRAYEALQQRERSDVCGLVFALASRVAANSAATEDRSVAAVLLRKVLSRNADTLLVFSPAAGGCGSGTAAWRQPGLGEALLEALASATHDTALRRNAADAAATAASLLFARGCAWPEFALLLARWCEGGQTERAAVLQILEYLRDEADGHDGGVLGAAASSGASLCALLAFLEDNGGCLQMLLAAAFRHGAEDETSQAAAARIFTYCAASSEVPTSLRDAVRSQSVVLAEVVVSDVAGGSTSAGSPRCEACLQAVALAARAAPELWAPTANGAMAALPSALATMVLDLRAAPEARSAALAAILEMCTAAAVAAAASLDSTLALRDSEHAEATAELAAHATAATAALLAELPSDDATESWAEGVDDGDAANVTGTENSSGGSQHASSSAKLSATDASIVAAIEGGEALLDDALDAAGRLISQGGIATEGLRTAVGQLLSSDAWQARHGALLLLLRFAVCLSGDPTNGCVHDTEMRIAAATAATQHLVHVHPRVRWAALEVWARLLALTQDEALCRIFMDALEGLMTLSGTSEHYVRVRRRALLVLVLAAQSPIPCFTAADAEPLFRRVLFPMASDPDCSVRDACSVVAHGAAAACGALSVEGDTMQERLACVAPGVAGLWKEFSDMLSTSASHAYDGGQYSGADGNFGDGARANGTTFHGIDWPSDWR